VLDLGDVTGSTTQENAIGRAGSARGAPTVADLTDPDEATFAACMAEAGRLLGSSLDTHATLRQLATVVVPGIADWCAIDLLAADGSLRSLVYAHRDEAQVALVRELHERYPSDPDAPVGAAAVARSGEPMMAQVTDEMIRAAARDARHLELISALHLRSWMRVPMPAGGRVLGTISFAGAETGRSFGARHLAFAGDLATRAAAALATAQAFQSADRFRRLLDAVAEAVFVLDPATGSVEEGNQGATDLLARPRAEILGTPFWALADGLAPDAARRVLESVVSGRSAAQTISLTVRRDAGHVVPVDVRLQHVELPGEGGRIVAIARDISDRVDVQRRLRRLAEAEHARAAELNAVIRAMGVGIVVCAPDGRITLINPAGEQMFPTVAETTYAQILRELDDPEQRAPQLGRTSGPVTLATRRDPERWIEIQTYDVDPHREGAGTGANETIVVLRDVTDQRQREAVRETFIGVLSHELRTPLTTIYGGAKLLARDDDRLEEGTRRAIFGDIVEETERLQRLVEDVVALNRFGGDDGGDLGREPVLLQRIVPVVVASEESRWPGVRFDVAPGAGLPTVVADPTYVEQTVRNLLSNAAKYGGAGSAVEVVLETSEDEVAVRVLDDGPGIDAGEAERVFDLFYRSPRTSVATAGAGIGLFVCARLVQAMGGRIWARPRPAGGAEVGFALRIMHED
jgi:PAS domain S-box-containing protein